MCCAVFSLCNFREVLYPLIVVMHLSINIDLANAPLYFTFSDIYKGCLFCHKTLVVSHPPMSLMNN